MAVGTYALTTWAKAQAMFGYLADQQTKVESLIDIATARMELYAKRNLLARAYTDAIIDGSGVARLAFPQWPVNSITTIYADDDRAFGVETAVASTEYQLNSAAGVATLYEDIWPSGIGTIKATYNAGYATTHAYYPVLESACLEFVNWMVTRWAGFIGKRVETNADGMNVGYEIEMPLNVKAALDDIARAGRWGLK